MGNDSTVAVRRQAWLDIADAPIVTANMATRALAAMEIVHTRLLDEQEPIARHLHTIVTEMDRPDLVLRTELVLVSIMLRNGSPTEASALLGRLSHDIETVADRYLAARAQYLRSWIAYFTGDEPSTRIHAARSIELLPDDAPLEIRADYISTLAIGHGRSADGQQYYDEALDLAKRSGDQQRMLTLHNNIAFSAMLRGDNALAADHVERLTATSESSGIPLKAVHLETIARYYLVIGDYQRSLATLAPVLAAVSGGAVPEDSAYFAEPHSIPTALLTLSETHRQLGQLDEAQALLDRARQVVADRNVTLVHPDVLREQAKIHAARRDYRSAYQSYVQYHEAAEAQQSDEQLARARIVQASFDADRTRKDAERYRELAMRDVLTGLYNRRYMNELLDAEIPRATAAGGPLSLAIVDADFFKGVNDQFSHDTGDQVLQMLARLLVSTRPEGMTVCRLGGEEFVIIMPGTAATGAQAACEQVRVAVAEHDWSTLVEDVPVTVSIGVTTAPAGRTSVAALLADADRNLYAAKRSGRNRVMGDSA